MIADHLEISLLERISDGVRRSSIQAEQFDAFERSLADPCDRFRERFWELLERLELYRCAYHEGYERWPINEVITVSTTKMIGLYTDSYSR